MDATTNFPHRRSSCLDFSPNIAPIFQRSLLPSAAKSFLGERSSTIFANGLPWSYYLTRIGSFLMSRQPRKSGCALARSATGGNDGLRVTSPWKMCWDVGVNPVFPPLDHALVKAMACELVGETKQPLSRQSLADVTARAQKVLGQPISRSTVWRIVHTDAIKPWRYKHCIFPRDPQFAEKAGPILDWYAGTWQGQPLGPKDHILSADEKTSIQARIRWHLPLPTEPARPHRERIPAGRGIAISGCLRRSPWPGNRAL